MVKWYCYDRIKKILWSYYDGITFVIWSYHDFTMIWLWSWNNFTTMILLCNKNITKILLLLSKNYCERTKTLLWLFNCFIILLRTYDNLNVFLTLSIANLLSAHNFCTRKMIRYLILCHRSVRIQIFFFWSRHLTHL